MQTNPLTAVDLYIDVSKLGLFVGASIYRRLLLYDHTKLQHNLYIDCKGFRVVTSCKGLGVITLFHCACLL